MYVSVCVCVCGVKGKIGEGTERRGKKDSRRGNCLGSAVVPVWARGAPWPK